MSKFMVVLVCAAGLCGPAGAATGVHASASTTTVTYATDAASNLSYQVGELQSTVQVLRGQVDALQNASIAQSDESAAELASIGTGG